MMKDEDTMWVAESHITQQEGFHWTQLLSHVKPCFGTFTFLLTGGFLLITRQGCRMLSFLWAWHGVDGFYFIHPHQNLIENGWEKWVCDRQRGLSRSVYLPVVSGLVEAFPSVIEQTTNGVLGTVLIRDSVGLLPQPEILQFMVHELTQGKAC